MKYLLTITFLYSFCGSSDGQGFANTNWYSETNSNGIVIQNSFPKGGPYTGPTSRNFNYSHLVFFTRVVNETETPLEFTIHFSADSIPIPRSPNTFVKLFLRSDTMTPAHLSLFNYGLKDLKSFDQPTRLQKTLQPKVEYLFCVEALSYQTVASAAYHDRGGNRAKFLIKGNDLYFSMPPQIGLLLCGKIISER